MSIYRGLGSAHIPSASVRQRMIGQKKGNLTERLRTDKHSPSCVFFISHKKKKKVHFNTSLDNRICQNNRGIQDGKTSSGRIPSWGYFDNLFPLSPSAGGFLVSVTGSWKPGRNLFFN